MSKKQTIIYLFVFLIVLFLVDEIFGNPLRENFGGGGGGGRGGLGGGRGLGVGGLGVGRGLGVGGLAGLDIRQNILDNNGYMQMSQSSDDQPFYFSFPFFTTSS